MSSQEQKIQTKLLKPTSLSKRIDLLPFIPVHAYMFYRVMETSEIFYETGWLDALMWFGVILAQGILWLTNFWSENARAFLSFDTLDVKDIKEATHIKVTKYIAKQKEFRTKIVDLQDSVEKDVKSPYFFEFEKQFYMYDSDKKDFFKYREVPEGSFGDFIGHQGLSLQEGRKIDEFKMNRFNIPIPKFLEIFKEHAVAPFFVFQIFSVLLWLIDEYWMFSIMTLVMLVLSECFIVAQRLKNLMELRGINVPADPIYVYRNKKWIKLTADQLMMGDVVSVLKTTVTAKQKEEEKKKRELELQKKKEEEAKMTPQELMAKRRSEIWKKNPLFNPPPQKKQHNLVPCDILLLRGNCIVDESMLTGESIPLLKESVAKKEDTHQFSLKHDGKLHVLYAGTKMVQNIPVAESQQLSIPNPPNKGCIGYVLRTGFNTSQGKLIRTIVFSSQRVGAGNRESYFFILILLIFAIFSASYVFSEGYRNPDRDKYRLILQCVIILTAVVPPELPMYLALTVNYTLIELQKMKIFCTEPFRVPYCGKVSVCCFDKTGTLTSDKLVLKGIAGNGASKSDSLDVLKKVKKVGDCDSNLHIILAGCHSLVAVKDAVVGDPVEDLALKELDWKYNHLTETTQSRDYKRVEILSRFQFTSDKKRMSTIVAYEDGSSGKKKHYVVAKGAPEVLQPLMSEYPDEFENLYTSFTLNGARVLCLAYKEYDVDPEQIPHLKQEDVEKDLKFAGLLLLDSPLKSDSYKVIKEIKEAEIKVVMITGDNLLTACNVALNLEMGPPSVLELCYDEKQSKFVFRNLKKDYVTDLDSLNEVAKTHTIAISGPVLAKLENEPKLLQSIVNQSHVFARTSPSQKALIIDNINKDKHTTLMCGDGTNDVGGLKKAHIGIALATADPTDATKKQALATTNTQNRKPNQQNPADAFKMEDGSLAPVANLGDASIAAPFTSRRPTIQSVITTLREGRCALATTYQMYKVLALNCLVSAYYLSALYLEGIKQSDSQALIAGVILSVAFLSNTKSESLKRISPVKPPSSIFHHSILVSVFVQFVTHFAVLVYLVLLSRPFVVKDESTKPDTEFQPNLINTVIFLYSIAIQMTDFVANYVGKPFKQDLTDRPKLVKSLRYGYLILFLLCSEMIPEINEAIELVPFPSQEFQFKVMAALALDFTIVYGIDRIVHHFVFREAKK